MRNFNIIVDKKISTSNYSNNIMTECYIEYQEKCFPDKQWTDFTEAVTTSWIILLLKYRCKCNVSFSMYFMDGPFRLDVYKNNKMELTINCINFRGTEEISELSFTCKYIDMISALYDATKSFNFILKSEGLHIGRFKPTYDQTFLTMKNIEEITNASS